QRRIGALLLVVLWGCTWLTGIFGGGLLRWYASGYHSLGTDSFRSGERYVLAVAGSSFVNDQRLPASCRFDDSMLLRLWEAGRLAQLAAAVGAEYQVVVSCQNGKVPPEERLRCVTAFMATMGIPEDRVELVDGTLNSRQEILAFIGRPGQLVVVSEAYHTPRLMALARKYGREAWASPAASGGAVWYFNALSIFPSAENLADFRLLVYECLGQLEYRLF
ncbi:MAG: YdcF family protein, partial [Oligosphaeraceae bacterium]|nr:YdcF family protein [Oligosphaeraceae bacterium]